MKLKLRDFKLFCFQREYDNYNIILSKIQSHILNLHKKNIININDKNLRLSDIYKIIGEINNAKKNYYLYVEEEYQMMINEEIESESETNYENELKNVSDTFNEMIKQFNNNITYEEIYKYLLSLNALPKQIHGLLTQKTNQINLLLNNKILYPLSFIQNSMIELISTIGLSNIDDMIILFNLDLSEMTNSENNLLKLYNEIFVPIRIIEISTYIFTSDDIELIEENNMFFTRKIFIKQNQSDNLEELLDNNYNMYIFINNKWFVITGFFKLNPLQIDVRLMTSTLYQNIFEKKNQIDKLLLESDKFKRKYLKYCSIHELITMSINKFIKYLDVKYRKFNEINNKSFFSLTKKSNDSNIGLLYWYETIKLLLLGSDENINVAGSLYLILKDKKTNIALDIIYDNLVFCNQMKLGKMNLTLKNELDKLNSFNFESTDFKKGLVSATHIPLYVRSMTMEKINEMKLNNNDYNKQLNYVKTILQFPWPSDSDDNIFQNLHNSKLDARKFIIDIDNKLNSVTYGHAKVKEQISLLVTKWISNPNSSGSAIGLMGPPGVGKTLIAKSLSKILDIPMIMITLGGQNDSELLIGHGYTYAAAQPGMIIKKMCEIGRGRCIMYFDELDKSCAKNGSINEITSILIHLTDPNTNKTFQDRFFQGIDFPLDKVIFITSYNDPSKIDPILLDRLIKLEVKPYNVEDKITILKKFIIPELKESIGINKNISIDEKDLKKFIYDFTAECGVRDLKHKMEQVLLNINKRDLFDDSDSTDISLDYSTIISYFNDNDRNHYKMISSMNKIGCINGLYATANGGGGITSIEICSIKTGDNFQLKLTGSMGDVMKESIQVAFTRACAFIADNSTLYNISDINVYIKDKFPYGFHIHTPDGATPKDGPSAGAAFTVGFISILLNKPSNRFVAMTGEMNLIGQVTKIGGLIFKLIGAKYAGVQTVLIPFENKSDMNEILISHPDLFDSTFQYIYIEKLSDVVKNVLIF